MRSVLPLADLDRLLDEDAPYGDLTTRALQFGSGPAQMQFSARYDMRVCGSEEAAALLQRLGADVRIQACSGTAVAAGAPLLIADGDAAALFIGWKLAQTLMEWASGIATATARIVAAARAVAPGIVVACTRKTPPLTRKLSAKAVLAGDGGLHRLGLSDSLLLFPEHRRFLPSPDDFAAAVTQLRAAAPERAVVIEVCNEDEALRAARAAPDVLQLEKFPPDAAARVVARLRAEGLACLVAIAGGVNAGNAAAYAASGAAVLVSSAPYAAPPCDVAVDLRRA